jgi:CheY-like chemotaxis protein
MRVVVSRARDDAAHVVSPSGPSPRTRRAFGTRTTRLTRARRGSFILTPTTDVEPASKDADSPLLTGDDTRMSSVLDMNGIPLQIPEQHTRFQVDLLPREGLHATRGRAIAGEVLLIGEESSDTALALRVLVVNGAFRSLAIAHGGEEALEMLRNGNGSGTLGHHAGPPPCFALVDLSARPSRLETVLELKKRTGTHRVPIVCLVGRSADALAAMNAGANSCILKPADTASLAGVLGAAVDYWARLNMPPSPGTDSSEA